jgi:hypothetical protein
LLDPRLQLEGIYQSRRVAACEKLNVGIILFTSLCSFPISFTFLLCFVVRLSNVSRYLNLFFLQLACLTAETLPLSFFSDMTVSQKK